MNDKQLAFQENYKSIQNQRDLFTLRAKINASGNYSGIEDSNKTQEVTNKNRVNLGNLATKAAMIAQFIDATDF